MLARTSLFKFGLYGILLDVDACFFHKTRVRFRWKREKTQNAPVHFGYSLRKVEIPGTLNTGLGAFRPHPVRFRPDLHLRISTISDRLWTVDLEVRGASRVARLVAQYGVQFGRWNVVASFRKFIDYRWRKFVNEDLLRFVTLDLNYDVSDWRERHNKGIGTYHIVRFPSIHSFETLSSCVVLHCAFFEVERLRCCDKQREVLCEKKVSLKERYIRTIIGREGNRTRFYSLVICHVTYMLTHGPRLNLSFQSAAGACSCHPEMLESMKTTLSTPF